MKHIKVSIVVLVISCFIIFSVSNANASQPSNNNTKVVLSEQTSRLLSNENFLPLNIRSLDTSKINVVLNGKVLSFDVNPINDSGRILLPVRGIFEAFGLQVDWDANTSTITATNDNNTVIMQVGAKEFSVNGSNISLDVPAKVIKGRTLVPVRAISEGLGMSADWNETVSAVFLNSGNVSQYYSNGVLEYCGQLDKKGLRTGYGKEYAANGKLIYSGQWLSDVRSGIGTFTWQDSDKYEGEFANGEPNGYGIFTHSGAGTYYGNYLNGIRSGSGTFIWLDGDKYVGNWLNDKMNGTGTYTFADGTVWSGYWSNNKYLG